MVIVPTLTTDPSSRHPKAAAIFLFNSHFSHNNPTQHSVLIEQTTNCLHHTVNAKKKKSTKAQNYSSDISVEQVKHV